MYVENNNATIWTNPVSHMTWSWAWAQYQKRTLFFFNAGKMLWISYVMDCNADSLRPKEKTRITQLVSLKIFPDCDDAISVLVIGMLYFLSFHRQLSLEHQLVRNSWYIEELLTTYIQKYSIWYWQRRHMSRSYMKISQEHSLSHNTPNSIFNGCSFVLINSNFKWYI